MNKTDIEVLQFRDELIKLCNKYKCAVVGSYSDWNDDFCIEFENKTYNVKADGYSVFIENRYEDRTYIIDEYIKNMYSDEIQQMQGLNNIKVNCIVFSNDSNKANDKMEEILNDLILLNVKYNVIKTKGGIKEITLEDGTRYIWVTPNENARSYRCNHAFIDRNLSLETIENYVIPISFYCSKDTVEMF